MPRSLTGREINTINLIGIDAWSKNHGIQPRTTRRYIRTVGAQHRVRGYYKKKRKRKGYEYTFWFNTDADYIGRRNTKFRLLDIEVKIITGKIQDIEVMRAKVELRLMDDYNMAAILAAVDGIKGGREPVERTSWDTNFLVIDRDRGGRIMQPWRDYKDD